MIRLAVEKKWVASLNTGRRKTNPVFYMKLKSSFSKEKPKDLVIWTGTFQCFPQCFPSAILCRNRVLVGRGQHLCLSEDIGRRLRLFPWFLSVFFTILKGSIKAFLLKKAALLLKKGTLLPSFSFSWEVAASTESSTTALAVAFICQLNREYSFVTMHFNVDNVNASLKIKTNTFCWLFFFSFLQMIWVWKAV